MPWSNRICVSRRRCYGSSSIPDADPCNFTEYRFQVILPPARVSGFPVWTNGDTNTCIDCGNSGTTYYGTSSRLLLSIDSSFATFTILSPTAGEIFLRYGLCTFTLTDLNATSFQIPLQPMLSTSVDFCVKLCSVVSPTNRR